MTKYKKVTPEIAAQLQAIVGAKRFFAGDAVKDDFSHDEMPIYGTRMPEAVCFPSNTEEVAAIMKLCNERKCPRFCVCATKMTSPSRRAVRARASSAGACRCAAVWCCARRA